MTNIRPGHDVLLHGSEEELLDLVKSNEEAVSQKRGTVKNYEWLMLVLRVVVPVGFIIMSFLLIQKFTLVGLIFLACNVILFMEIMLRVKESLLRERSSLQELLQFSEKLNEAIKEKSL